MTVTSRPPTMAHMWESPLLGRIFSSIEKRSIRISTRPRASRTVVCGGIISCRPPAAALHPWHGRRAKVVARRGETPAGHVQVWAISSDLSLDDILLVCVARGRVWLSAVSRSPSCVSKDQRVAESGIRPHTPRPNRDISYEATTVLMPTDQLKATPLHILTLDSYLSLRRRECSTTCVHKVLLSNRLDLSAFPQSVFSRSVLDTRRLMSAALEALSTCARPKGSESMSSVESSSTGTDSGMSSPTSRRCRRS